ncbi:MAG: hypothetical protein ACK56I_17135, partial [bacterium]
QYLSPFNQEVNKDSQNQKQSPPVKLTFENLEFEVKVPVSHQESKKLGERFFQQKIVKGASGYALPG